MDGVPPPKKMVPLCREWSHPWRGIQQMSRLTSGLGRMKLSIQLVLGWFSRRAKQWQLVYSSMFEARDSSNIALQLLTQQVVESRVECVLWKEDGRVALVEKTYYFLTEKR